MRVFLTLTRRELASYFLSLTGYVIIAAATVLTGICLCSIIEQLLLKPMPMPLNELFFSTWYPWLVLIPVAPLITMRSFALEKSSGTYETLMTAPVWLMQLRRIVSAALKLSIELCARTDRFAGYGIADSRSEISQSASIESLELPKILPSASRPRISSEQQANSCAPYLRG